MDIRYDLKDLSTAVEVVKKGGIILYPTDTVWGIGCDATNRKAIERIYRLKQRTDSKSMLVLVGNERQLEMSVNHVPEQAWMLLEAALNPLTIIYDEPIGIAENLISEDGSLGIRITEEPFSQSLCLKLKRPIVSTSANISGNPTPNNFSEISDEIIKGVDYVVNYRQNDLSKSSPSNIIKIKNNGVIKIIR